MLPRIQARPALVIDRLAGKTDELLAQVEVPVGGELGHDYPDQLLDRIDERECAVDAASPETVH